MADILVSVPVSTAQIQFVSGQDTIADLGGAVLVVLRTSADVLLGFDQPTSSTQSFKLLSANTADTAIDTQNHGTINKIYARGATGSGTLYIIYVI